MTYRPMTPRTKYRMPEHGRIRLGVQVPTKTGKTRPEKLTTLRFTSQDRAAIEALAALYGGQARPWQNGNRAEYEVITEAPEVRIVLPEDPLGDTPFYEMWAGRSLQRRCDGETAVVPTRVGKDDVDLVECPCICNEQKRAECKVTSRLSVIIPNIPFGGTWRVESHSWNAADELPGMVHAVQEFSRRSPFVMAFLRIEERSKVEAGQTKSFIVPVLRISESIEQVLGGAGQLDAITAPAAAGELTTGTDGHDPACYREAACVCDGGQEPPAPAPPPAPGRPVPPAPPSPPVAQEDGILYVQVNEAKNQLKSAILTLGLPQSEARNAARRLWNGAQLSDEPDDMVDEAVVADLIDKAAAELNPGRPFA